METKNTQYIKDLIATEESELRALMAISATAEAKLIEELIKHVAKKPENRSCSDNTFALVYCICYFNVMHSRAMVRRRIQDLRIMISENPAPDPQEENDLKTFMENIINPKSH